LKIGFFKSRVFIIPSGVKSKLAFIASIILGVSTFEVPKVST
jgi:hypothetical protein